MAKKWTQPEVEDILCREMAAILSMKEDDIKPSTTLISLGIDSIRFVEIMIFVENEFGIRLIDSGMSRDTLHDVASLSAHIAATASAEKDGISAG